MDVFYRKNDIGVDIEYTVVAGYKDAGRNYIIYTDFVSDNSNKAGIRLFVNEKKDGKKIRLDRALEKKIIDKFNNDLLDVNIK